MAVNGVAALARAARDNGWTILGGSPRVRTEGCVGCDLRGSPQLSGGVRWDHRRRAHDVPNAVRAPEAVGVVDAYPCLGRRGRDGHVAGVVCTVKGAWGGLRVGERAASHPRAGRPADDECTIQSEAPVTATAPALCGTLEVPEDRSNPGGRTTTLRVAVIPALSPNSLMTPSSRWPVGPVEPGRRSSAGCRGLFADVHATRDIVLVDQRGTGGSNPLVLPPMPDTTGLWPAEVDAHLQTWSAGGLASIEADPRQYTSSVAADDLDAVREALGYELIDLYGTSYGATLAQYYIRQHPDHVRVAIMDGGTPLDVPAFERMAANSQAALELLFERCRRRCLRPALPDLSTEWSELAAALADGIDTGMTDPDSGEPGGDARPGRPRPPPGAAGPDAGEPAAARDPPRPRGAVAQVVAVFPESTGAAATGWR